MQLRRMVGALPYRTQAPFRGESLRRWPATESDVPRADLRLSTANRAQQNAVLDLRLTRPTTRRRSPRVIRPGSGQRHLPLVPVDPAEAASLFEAVLVEFVRGGAPVVPASRLRRWRRGSVRRVHVMVETVPGRTWGVLLLRSDA